MRKQSEIIQRQFSLKQGEEVASERIKTNRKELLQQQEIKVKAQIEVLAELSPTE